SYAPATTHSYTLSLHDALPIFEALDARPGLIPITAPHEGVVVSMDRFRGAREEPRRSRRQGRGSRRPGELSHAPSPPFAPKPCRDRKSTRLNSSHVSISYAVFC